MSLCGGHITGTDQPYALVAIRVRNNDEPLAIRVSSCQKSILFGRVIWIVDSQCERITEYCRSLVERDAVIELVLLILFPRPIQTASRLSIRCTRAPDAGAALARSIIGLTAWLSGRAFQRSASAAC